VVAEILEALAVLVAVVDFEALLRMQGRQNIVLLSLVFLQVQVGKILRITCGKLAMSFTLMLIIEVVVLSITLQGVIWIMLFENSTNQNSEIHSIEAILECCHLVEPLVVIADRPAVATATAVAGPEADLLTAADVQDLTVDQPDHLAAVGPRKMCLIRELLIMEV
jgi:heme/copper-type cytochrome/quinol oxidase subunit 4